MKGYKHDLFSAGYTHRFSEFLPRGNFSPLQIACRYTSSDLLRCKLEDDTFPSSIAIWKTWSLACRLLALLHSIYLTSPVNNLQIPILYTVKFLSDYIFLNYLMV